MLKRINKRIEALENLEVLCHKADRSFKMIRASLIAAIVAALIVFSFLESDLWLRLAAISLLLLVFILISLRHKKLLSIRDNIQAYTRLSRTDLARLRLDWENIPLQQTSTDADHPFARDLDITGEYSLHRLLDICVSREGSDRLLQWLKISIPEQESICHRQRLVSLLVPLSSLRRSLYLLLHKSPRLESKRLHQWLKGDNTLSLKPIIVIFMTLLGLTNLLFLILHLALITGPIWIPGLMLYFSIMIMMTHKTQPILQDSADIESHIRDLRQVLKYLESYPLSHKPELALLFKVFHGEDSPSRDLGLLDRTLNMIGWRSNVLMALLLNTFIPWDMYCAGLAIKSRLKFQHSLPLWLNALAELDALNSLAHYAVLHPDSIFPDILSDQVSLAAAEIGHPLIIPDQRICNDIKLDKVGQIMLITGSNMSGKSSFLKTLGINLALAYAGATVQAQTFKTSLFRLASCININDSITAGYSFFYTEVRRLKSILDLLEGDSPIPVLFLIDEIFKGTNNKERLIGSRSLIHKLSVSNGLGLVTTHDLELVQLEQELESVTNHHFREHIEDGQMSFDYKFRAGPCPTTNALKIMQMEGLPVDEDLM